MKNYSDTADQLVADEVKHFMSVAVSVAVLLVVMLSVALLLSVIFLMYAYTRIKKRHTVS